MFYFLSREHYHDIGTDYKLTLVRFIFSLGTASAGTVWGLYMHSIGFSDSAVGFITSAAVLFALVFTLLSTPILEFLQARRVLIISLALFVVSYVLVTVVTSKVLFVGIAIMVATITTLRVQSFGILFRDSVSRNNLAEREGLLFSLANLSWFIGPIGAGFLLGRYGFESVFLTSASMFFIALLMLSIWHVLSAGKVFRHIDGNVYQNIHHFESRKELRYPYAMKFGLSAINGFFLIYLPIFLFNKGVAVEYIGMMIGVSALLHALLDFKVGSIAKSRNFKPFLVSGFVLAALLLILLSFIDNGYLLLAVAVLLGSSSILIEPLQDTFFFSFLQNSKEEERLYPLYNTAGQLGGFFIKFSIAIVLLFAPERFAYFVLAALLILIALFLSDMNEKKLCSSRGLIDC